MTLPVSGAISFNNINVELGVAGTTQASLGQASYRTLSGVASGAISMSNFYGKANQFSFTIASNQSQADLRTLAINAGWGGASKVVATINSGVDITSGSTGSYALTIAGSFPGGVSLINNGRIIGRGGNGGRAGGYNTGGYTGGAGSGGGPALNVTTATSITNNNIIAGGGGGGGGAAMFRPGKYDYGGGGGGGGAGVSTGYRPNGTPNASGTLAQDGSLTTAGNGGGGQAGNPGGNGGSWGTAGVSRTGEGSVYGAGGAGGAAGVAVQGNSNVTWVATGTRYGPLAG